MITSQPPQQQQLDSQFREDQDQPSIAEQCVMRGAAGGGGVRGRGGCGAGACGCGARGCGGTGAAGTDGIRGVIPTATHE